MLFVFLFFALRKVALYISSTKDVQCISENSFDNAKQVIFEKQLTEYNFLRKTLKVSSPQILGVI